MRAAQFTALQILLLAAVGCAAGTTADCHLPESVVYASGEPTGFVRCEDGATNRLESLPVALPGELQRCVGTELVMACTVDSACYDSSNGQCTHFDKTYANGDASGLCSCTYFCTSDDDCAEDEACIAAELTGGTGNAVCQPASCHSADDCASGECGLVFYNAGCGDTIGLFCRDATTDECRMADDCAPENDGTECGPWYAGDGDRYRCFTSGCSIGRPLLVAAEPRVASGITREDWHDDLAPSPPPDPNTRAALAQHWTEIAALEHASVGSFARVTLQLLALGAPAHLLLATQEAAADEVRHARFAYTLASRYAGSLIGPGPLLLADAMPALDPEGALLALLDEACIGETLGAAEALAAAEASTDSEVRAGLLQIAADEARHAALAWRTLRWLLDTHPELRPIAATRCAEVMGDAHSATLRASSSTTDLTNWGVLTGSMRAEVHRRTLRLVVEPVARALFTG